MEEKTMNILLSCDDRIAKYIPVLQASLYENHKGISVRVFIMHTKISADIMNEIKSFADKNGQEIIEIIANNDDFEIFKKVDPKRLGLFPVEAFYHFLACNYLPGDIDRCMYLDVDLICDDNIYEWYCTEFEDHFYVSTERYSKDNFSCFNSGVFLINLKKFRDTNLNKDFYLKKIEQMEKEGEKGLLGDQEFIGYAFKDFADNGFKSRWQDGLNFRIMHSRDKAIGISPIPKIKIVHYNSPLKAWNCYFDDSFKNLYIGKRLWSANYDFQVISENVISLYGLFWKYAEATPFYKEIKATAIAITNEMKRLAFTRNMERRREMLLQAVEIKESRTQKDNVGIIPAAFLDYGIRYSAENGFAEYKTQFYVKDQWIVFPLSRMLKKGDEITVRLNCEFKTGSKIWFFLSDYNLKTQHFPIIATNKYKETVIANADGYQFLCLATNSFPEKGDYIRFYEMEINMGNNVSDVTASAAVPSLSTVSTSEKVSENIGGNRIAILGRYNNANYGGKLTVLATFSTVKELGFEPMMLRLKGASDDPELLYNKLCTFTKVSVNDPMPPKGWNAHFDSFLLCSDWTFHKNWFLPLEIRMFDWVTEGKNIVSFASSFGTQSGGYGEQEYPLLRKRLKRFTSLSVREQSGVELCRKIGVDHAVQMPDPVFSQKREYYLNIANMSSCSPTEHKFAAVYLLDMDKETISLALKIAEHIGLPPLFIVAFKDRGLIDLINGYDFVSAGADGVSEWLYYLNCCDYIITNSFHSVCFSFIFGKNFSVIDRKDYSDLRVKSLLAQFEASGKFIKNEGDIAGSVGYELNFEKINVLLDRFYSQSRSWIKDALSGKQNTKAANLRIDMLPANNCTGCFACGYSCPKKCIVPIRDEKSGFIYPKIKYSDCINCGLCAKACPILQGLKPSKQDTSVYCGFSLDNEIRYNSTSGGFFSELALNLLHKGNTVIFGAAYETPSKVCHIEITSPEDLPKIRQSKYVQSEIRGAYPKIQNHLQAGKTVLFCGTPCQCGAVKQYMTLKQVDTENLYLVDFICHSVNSPYAYEAYLHDIEKQYGKVIKSVWFKNKEKSWNRFSTRIDFDKSDSYYIKDRDEDDYYKGFLKYHLYSRPSCFDCRFKGLERVSDISLADAWGVELKQNDNKHGVSTAIIHSEKGRRLFDDIKSRVYCEEKDPNALMKGNVNLMNSTKPGEHSDYFYQRLAQKVPFSQIIREIETGALVKSEDKPVAPDKVFDGVELNGAVVRAHPTAQIIVRNGGKLILNNDRFHGSNAECLIDLREGAKLIVEGNFKIYYGCRLVVHKGAVLTLGSGYMNTDTKVICKSRIDIGDAFIGPDCYIIDSDFHAIMDKNGKVINPHAPVKFDGHIWLGQNVTVLKGVTIGNGSCVGAKSLVTKDIPPNSLAVGNPAAVIRSDITWK